MKPKRKIWYAVCSSNWEYWWSPKFRKWITWGDSRGNYGVQSHKNCRTFDQAYRIARRVPSGVAVITQFKIIKGERWARDYYYDVHNNE